jgi:hypothetical protein
VVGLLTGDGGAHSRAVGREVTMGDKSPKSKNKNKQQNDAAKGKKAAAAATKQAPSTQK